MKENINWKTFKEELAEKIRKFYPYFLSFYFFSLFIALFSTTWRTFFHWPAFHGAALFYTFLVLLTYRFKIKYRFLYNIIKSQLLREIKKHLNLFKKLILKLNRRDWSKILIIALVLTFALIKDITVIDFALLTYALVSIIYILDSRYAAGAALFFLITCPFLLILKKDDWAETAAIYAYYFLIITVITQIRELKREEK